MQRNIVVLALALVASVLGGCAQVPRMPWEPEAKAPATKPEASAGQEAAKTAPAPAPQAPTAVAITPVSTQIVAVDPQGFASLQPFRKFAKGEGYGVALEYVPRNKAQFVAWLRAGKAMRVSCDVLVRQMSEVHNLPFEGCEGSAAEILRNDDYQVVACRDEMFQKDGWLAVTNPKGTVWGVWHRPCLAGELILVYKGRPVISTTCGNTVIPVKKQMPTSTTKIATRECPNGFLLVASAWSCTALPAEFQAEAQELVAVAEGRETEEGQRLAGYEGDAFSRTLGGRLRTEIGTRAPFTGSLTVRFVEKDSQTNRAVSAREVGTLQMVNGTGIFRFAEDPRKQVIETSWPADFLSPVVSGGERRLRLFPEEWGKWCTMHIHGLVP